MAKKTPSETTRPPEKEPSAYQLVREHLRHLSRNIQAYDFRAALDHCREFRGAVQEYITPLGLDTSDLMKLMRHLECDIINGAVSEYLKAKQCTERLNEIVNMLPDYGLYLGQHIGGSGDGEGDPLDIMYHLNASLDNLSLHFTEQSIGKEEMNAALKQLQQAVNSYTTESKEMTILRRYLLRCISDTMGEMNSVNLEQPGKMTFQRFSRSAAELQHALNDFLLSRDNPLYRQVFLKDVMDHATGGDEETAADYYASLSDDSELREAFRQLFDEFMDEHDELMDEHEKK